MRQIAVIRQQDVQPDYIDKTGIAFEDRYAARAVLVNESGKIALLHMQNNGYYKLPGGGLENDEDAVTALYRELLEEVGATADIIAEIGSVEEWRVSDDEALHQIGYAYLARVSGDIAEPQFTEKEIANGAAVYWAANINDAIQLVSQTKHHENNNVKFMSIRETTILEAARAMGA